jgi:histidine ammonia-lyase
VFSRSTENHNQDKVSMGTIAARDCASILEMAEHVAAINTLAMVQAGELRGIEECGPGLQRLTAHVRKRVARVDFDRALDHDIALVLEDFREGRLPVGEAIA